MKESSATYLFNVHVKGYMMIKSYSKMTCSET